MKIPFVCKSESFVSLSLWKLIHVIPNFDIMRCDFQRCTTSSCYIANQFSYQDNRKKILIRRSLFFFFFFSGLLKCIRMKDNEGNINSKILILLLFFSFEDELRISRKSRVCSRLHWIDPRLHLFRKEKKADERMSPCFYAYRAVGIVSKILSIFKTTIPRWYYI